MAGPAAFSFSSYNTRSNLILNNEQLKTANLEARNITGIRLHKLREKEFARLKEAVEMLPLQTLSLRNCFPDFPQQLNEILSALGDNFCIQVRFLSTSYSPRSSLALLRCKHNGCY